MREEDRLLRQVSGMPYVVKGVIRNIDGVCKAVIIALVGGGNTTYRLIAATSSCYGAETFDGKTPKEAVAAFVRSKVEDISRLQERMSDVADSPITNHYGDSFKRVCVMCEHWKNRTKVGFNHSTCRKSGLTCRGETSKACKCFELSSGAKEELK